MSADMLCETVGNTAPFVTMVRYVHQTTASNSFQLWWLRCIIMVSRCIKSIHIHGIRIAYGNILRPRQNGRHLANDTLKRISLNDNGRISIGISLTFVPRAQINNISALVQIMAWRRPGDRPLSEPWWLDYWRIYTSLGLNELRV